MVEKISNTKEISSEYQKIENRLSNIDNKVNQAFTKTVSLIVMTSVLSSYVIISITGFPLLVTMNSAFNPEVFYFTLEKINLIFGIMLLALVSICLFITYKCYSFIREKS